MLHFIHLIFSTYQIRILVAVELLSANVIACPEYPGVCCNIGKLSATSVHIINSDLWTSCFPITLLSVVELLLKFAEQGSTTAIPFAKFQNACNNWWTNNKHWDCGTFMSQCLGPIQQRVYELIIEMLSKVCSYYMKGSDPIEILHMSRQLRKKLWLDRMINF